MPEKPWSNPVKSIIDFFQRRNEGQGTRPLSPEPPAKSSERPVRPKQGKEEGDDNTAQPDR
jgi:hypothetical protein